MADRNQYKPDKFTTLIPNQKIEAPIKGRIETGELQINDDWPGIFVRGDDCITLRHILNECYRDDLDVTQTSLIFTLLDAIGDALITR